jgi:hypothetical protein
MGVLAAALTAIFGVLIGGKLLRLWDPVFEVPRFESASIDRFWLRVDTRGELDVAAIRAELEPTRPIRHLILEVR